MARVLFGKERDSETNKIRTILADANIPYFFTDVGHQFSDLRDVLQVLSNSTKLPVMVDEGGDIHWIRINTKALWGDTLTAKTTHRCLLGHAQ